MTAGVTRRITIRRTTAEVVGGAFVVWGFIWENGRQALGDVANPAFVLPLPRATKLLEVFTLVVLLLYVLVVRRNRAFDWVAGITVLIIGVVVTACSSVIGVAAGYTTPSVAMNTSYAYLAPLILAGVVNASSQELDNPNWLLRVFESLVVVNAVVAWYQFGIQGAWGDTVHGAMHDAHMYANAAWLGVLLMLVRLYNTRQGFFRSAVLLLLFTPTAWAAQYEMAELAVVVVLLGGVFAVLWRRGLKWRWLAMAGYITAGLLFVGAIQRDRPLVSWLGRIELVTKNLGALGVVEGYRQVPSAMFTAPHSLLIGTSPGSYGSPNAVQRVLMGSEPAPLVERFTGESYELNEATQGFLGSFVQTSTDLSVMFVEFGPFVLFCSALAFWLLVLRPALSAFNSPSMADRVAGVWVTVSSAYLLLLSAGTAFYAWSASHASVFPVVVTGALLTHRNWSAAARKAHDSTNL